MVEQNCPTSYGRDIDHDLQNHIYAKNWKFASPQSSYAEILAPQVMALGGGAFEK